jgi:hypothetical protein
MNDDDFSNIEYTKSVIKALNEALDENEKVSNVYFQLNADNF